MAAENEYAWNKTQAEKLDEECIGVVGRGNRMICWPCEFFFFSLVLRGREEGNAND